MQPHTLLTEQQIRAIFSKEDVDNLMFDENAEFCDDGLTHVTYSAAIDIEGHDLTLHAYYIFDKDYFNKRDLSELDWDEPEFEIVLR
ncbi:MAG: hypothetical protein DRQ48_00895 [Gammaproteobacteria bacterium]|nr:MAG: hypothetical protein DRQ44_00475 [Gammaproteobacteria bacterium]RKZ72236.1 MAG: hypothetical protein DRQ48_00895 [Gammaproteobacteria bacterium]